MGDILGDIVGDIAGDIVGDIVGDISEASFALAGRKAYSKPE